MNQNCLALNWWILPRFRNAPVTDENTASPMNVSIPSLRVIMVVIYCCQRVCKCCTARHPTSSCPGHDWFSVDLPSNRSCSRLHSMQHKFQTRSSFHDSAVWRCSFKKTLASFKCFLTDFASQIRLRFDSVTVGCVASSSVPEKLRQIGKLRLVNVENINCVENWKLC